MITFKKLLPENVWSKKNKLTPIVLDAELKVFNVNFRKCNGFYGGFKVIDLKKNDIAIDVRFYNTTGRANYCAMWIYSDLFTSSGTGRACGWGYDRESAAFNNAIVNCGIKGFPCFSGSGDNLWAIETLVKILGIKKYKIVEIFA